MAEPLYCYRHPDRETMVSCSDCGRPICPDCMVFAPVGIRCPDHSGQARGAARVVRNVQRRTTRNPGVVTTTMIAINVGIYLLQLAGGASINANSGWIFEHGALFGPYVAQGDWYRLLSAAFLHYGPIHLGMNMLALWWIGRPLEAWLGPVKYVLLYLVTGLAGSAGALIANPTGVTVGASGAIFGILGAALILERQRNYVLGGSALSFLIINLIITFAIPNISIGGHLGGLAGGILATLALSRFGRTHAIYGRPGLVGAAGVVAVGVASVALAYWRVQGLV